MKKAKVSVAWCRDDVENLLNRLYQAGTRCSREVCESTRRREIELCETVCLSKAGTGPSSLRSFPLVDWRQTRSKQKHVPAKTSVKTLHSGGERLNGATCKLNDRAQLDTPTEGMIHTHVSIEPVQGPEHTSAAHHYRLKHQYSSFVALLDELCPFSPNLIRWPTANKLLYHWVRSFTYFSAYCIGQLPCVKASKIFESKRTGQPRCEICSSSVDTARKSSSERPASKHVQRPKHT